MIKPAKPFEIKRPMPVQAQHCKTCPFNFLNWEKYPILKTVYQERLTHVFGTTLVCHSTTGGLPAFDLAAPKLPKSKQLACRGGRDLQMEYFYAIGFLPEKTDEAWLKAWENIQNGRKPVA